VNYNETSAKQTMTYLIMYYIWIGTILQMRHTWSSLCSSWPCWRWFCLLWHTQLSHLEAKHNNDIVILLLFVW